MTYAMNERLITFRLTTRIRLDHHLGQLGDHTLDDVAAVNRLREGYTLDQTRR